jgi:hypothetical protein
MATNTSPKKDVIYIDIEDDITAIIDKLKGSEQAIVALVPPKNTQVLQSVVNMRLLQKAADSVQKRVVIITGNDSLTHLAASVRIPVAKNLQSRPEVAEIAALEVDDEDVINGEELPIGDLDAARNDAPEPIVTVDEPKAGPVPLTPSMASQAGSGTKKSPSKPKKSIGVPNFDLFRKKALIIGGAAIVLVIFLYWAMAIAPSARIEITAKTTPEQSLGTLTLKQGAALDTKAKLLPMTKQQLKKPATVSFEATGKKDVGEKASGSVRIRNCDSGSSFTIDAGTVARSETGLRFVATSTVTVPGFTGSASACRTTGSGAGIASLPVSAEQIGADYNIGPSGFDVSGVSGDIYAASTEAFTGGSKQTITVVSAADVEKAKGQLADQNSTAIKSELTKLFKGEMIIINDSFMAQAAAPVSRPALGEEAKTATLTADTTFTMVAIAKTDLDKMLNDDILLGQDHPEEMKVYKTGSAGVEFSNYSETPDAVTVQYKATGQLGPKVEENDVARNAVGKRSGEIQQALEGMDGISKAEVTLSPFWVSTAPKAEKITVVFTVDND